MTELELKIQNDASKTLEQLKHQAFMKDIAPHLFGGIPSALFAWYLFYDLSSTFQQFLWCSGYIIIGAICAIIYYFYYKKNSQFSLQQWNNFSHSIIILLAAYWSLPPFLLLNEGNTLYALVLLFHILAICVSPASTIIYYPKAYILFISLPMLSFFVFLITSHIKYDFFIYLVPIGCLISLLLYGIKLKNNVFKSLSLQVENIQAWKSAEQANIAKSKFLAAASHDIRQPLQATSLLLEAFDETKQDMQNQQLLKHLKSSVNGMSELLNSLLDVSKLDAQVIEVEPKHIDIQILCKELLSETEKQNQKKTIDFHLLCPTSITAYADVVILKRVLNNLLSNALRYTERGSITLSVEQRNQSIALSVIDTGIGIKYDEGSAIFDEFYQSKSHNKPQKGMGLGLSIVKRLCKLHDWEINFKSTYLQGSTFTIVIQSGDKSAISKQPSSSSTNTLNGISVLIIDDEPIIRKGLQSLLEKWGCTVRAFENPDIAIEDLRDCTKTKPDLVITDYRLGHKKNGIETIQYLHQHIDPNIEAILITGDTGVEEIQNAQESGFVVLHKPVKPAKLRKAIQIKMKYLN